MNNKYVLPNLARYFREMKNEATSHDKIALLLSVAILVSCGAWAYRDLTTSMQWPKSTVLLVGVAILTTVWLVSFALGVILRARTWLPVFPPYQLIGRAAVPALVTAIIAGSVAGTVLFEMSLVKSAGVSFLGYIVVLIIMHFLFLLHLPITRIAVRLTHNPNIMTVDSHRYMWLFPAIGVLVLLLAGKALATEDAEAVRHIAVTAAIATSTTLAGFGAGFIP
jgi:hypothetical protein